MIVVELSMGMFVNSIGRVVSQIVAIAPHQYIPFCSRATYLWVSLQSLSLTLSQQ